MPRNTQCRLLPPPLFGVFTVHLGPSTALRATMKFAAGMANGGPSQTGLACASRFRAASPRSVRWPDGVFYGVINFPLGHGERPTLNLSFWPWYVESAKVHCWHGDQDSATARVRHVEIPPLLPTGGPMSAQMDVDVPSLPPGPSHPQRARAAHLHVPARHRTASTMPRAGRSRRTVGSMRGRLAPSRAMRGLNRPGN